MTSLALADLAVNDNRQGKPWTEEEDRVLFVKGPVYGYGAIAQRLGRTEYAGYKRIAWLKQRKE